MTRLWTVTHCLLVFLIFHAVKHNLLPLMKLNLQLNICNVSGYKVCNKKCPEKWLRQLCFGSYKEENSFFLFFVGFCCFFSFVGGFFHHKKYIPFQNTVDLLENLVWWYNSVPVCTAQGIHSNYQGLDIKGLIQSSHIIASVSLVETADSNKCILAKQDKYFIKLD